MIERNAGRRRAGSVLHQQSEGAMLQEMTKTKLRALSRTRKCDDIYPDTAFRQRKQAIDQRARQHSIRAGYQDCAAIERRPSGCIG
jgi:Tfp pilus assembly protein FimV